MILGNTKSFYQTYGLQPYILVTATELSTINIKLNSVLVNTYTLVGAETSHTFEVAVNQTAYTVECISGISIDSRSVLVETARLYKVKFMIPLKYIECNGHQYIDTGVVANATLSFQAELMRYSTSGNFWSGGNSWPSANVQLSANNEFGYYSSRGYSIVLYSGSNNVKFTVTQTLPLSSCDMSFSWRISQDNCPSSMASSYHLMLFAHNAAGTIKEFLQGRAYYINIDSENVAIRRYLPKYNTSINRPGLYDSVYGDFYTNIGTGEFGYETLDGTYVAPV